MGLLQLHVALSLIGIATGLYAYAALLSGRILPAWTGVFLAATILTSVTGFPLPPFGFDPARAIGILSLVVLAVAAAALYRYRLVGVWRAVYIVAAGAALYLNGFVAVVQTFQKIPAAHALAPTQTEAPFIVAQVLVLGAVVALGVLALRRFRPGF